jgi:hypothetical protein
MRGSYSSARVCLFASLKKVEGLVLVVDFCICCFFFCSKWVTEQTKTSTLGSFGYKSLSKVGLSEKANSIHVLCLFKLVLNFPDPYLHPSSDFSSTN